MLDVNQTKLNQEVIVEMQDGTTKSGKIKGIYEDCKGVPKVTVEYLTPCQNNFDLDKVSPVTEA